MGNAEPPAGHSINSRLGLMARCMEGLHARLGMSPLFVSLGSIDEDIAVVTVTRFGTEADANTLWETVALNLINNNVGPANVWPEVDGVFEELALNAAQHSGSQQGSYGTVEIDFSDDAIVYVIGIADGGIGIPASFRGNLEYASIANDEDAIFRATESDVTGTMESRGAGLHHVIEKVRAFGGELTIISGEGYLMVRGGQEPILGRMVDLVRRPYQGTTVLVALPIPTMNTSDGDD